VTAEEAKQIINVIWSSNLDDPYLGGDDTWNSAILAAEEIVEDVMTRILRSNNQGLRVNITRRCCINDTVRKVTNFVPFYSRILYISTNLLRETSISIQEGAKGKRALRSYKFEHVIPLAVYGSGTRIIENPICELPRLRRAILSPTCLITLREDNLLKRNIKSHPCPFLPFSRYKNDVEVRRTDTGEIVDPYRFNFRDHMRHMMAHPAYATAVPLLAGGKRRWREYLNEVGHE
jgi:hypothetical protein